MYGVMYFEATGDETELVEAVEMDPEEGTANRLTLQPHNKVKPEAAPSEGEYVGALFTGVMEGSEMVDVGCIYYDSDSGEWWIENVDEVPNIAME